MPVPPARSPDTAKIGVGYVRMSMYREEAISPELQRSAIEAKAARDGVTIPEKNWIVELGVTGRNFARQGVQDAIERIERGDAAFVYVWKFSRFGRNAMLVAVNNFRIEETGGQLVSATEDVDASTAVGKLTRGMIQQIDEFMSNNAGEQWQEAHARRRSNGLPHTGAPRMGYKYHRTTVGEKICPQGCKPGECVTGYVVDPETAPIVVEMYRRYSRGESHFTIASWLNGIGVTTTKGRAWRRRSVERFLDTGWAAGLLRVHADVCGCKRAHNCGNKVYIPGAHDAILLPEDWAKYLRNRKRRRYLAPLVENAVYPLAGLVKCGRCGYSLWAQSVNHRDSYDVGYVYKCSQSSTADTCSGTWIARGRLEKLILAWVGDIAGADAEKRAAVAVARTAKQERRSVDRKKHEREVQKLSAALTQLTVDKAKGILVEEAYVAARDDITADLERERGILDELADPEADTAGPPVEVARAVVEEWSTLSPGGRQQMLNQLITKIRVTSHGRGNADVLVTTTWDEVVDLKPPERISTEDVVRRYRAGQSLQEIADAIGSHNTTVRARLIQAGEPRRPAGGSSRRRHLNPG